MNPTTDILAALDAIDALAAKAEVAPWHYVHGYGFSFHTTGDGSPTPSTRFVCASRDGWPATVAALRVAVEALEAQKCSNPDCQYGQCGDINAALSAVRALLKGEKP